MFQPGLSRQDAHRRSGARRTGGITQDFRHVSGGRWVPPVETGGYNGTKSAFADSLVEIGAAREAPCGPAPGA